MNVKEKIDSIIRRYQLRTTAELAESISVKEGTLYQSINRSGKISKNIGVAIKNKYPSVNLEVLLDDNNEDDLWLDGWDVGNSVGDNPGILELIEKIEDPYISKNLRIKVGKLMEENIKWKDRWLELKEGFESGKF